MPQSGAHSLVRASSNVSSTVLGHGGVGRALPVKTRESSGARINQAARSAAQKILRKHDQPTTIAACAAAPSAHRPTAPALGRVLRPPCPLPWARGSRPGRATSSVWAAGELPCSAGPTLRRFRGSLANTPRGSIGFGWVPRLCAPRLMCWPPCGAGRGAAWLSNPPHSEAVKSKEEKEGSASRRPKIISVSYTPTHWSALGTFSSVQKALLQLCAQL